MALIERMLAAGKSLAAVCHAPAVLRQAKIAGVILVMQDTAVTGFTNTEEEATGLTQVVPFLVEDMLKQHGSRYSKVATGSLTSSPTS